MRRIHCQLLWMNFSDKYSISDTTVLHTLRGHDADVICMEWMCLDPSDIKSDPQDTQRGLSTSAKCLSNGSSQSLLVSEDQTSDRGDDESDHHAPEVGAEAVEIEKNSDETSGINGLAKHDEPTSESTDNLITEINSDKTPETNDAIDDLDLDLGGNASTEQTVANDLNATQLRYYLATGAQESFVYIWDTQCGKIMHKINLKTHGKSTIPSKFYRIQHSIDSKV